MVASSIRLWHIWTTNPTDARCNSQHFHLFFFVHRLSLAAFTLTLSLSLSPSVCIGFGFSCFVCPIRSLASFASCCCYCIITTIVVVAVTATTTADTVISSLIHSFIHSSSIADIHTHSHRQTHLSMLYAVHFPFLLCAFAFSLSIFPPLPKNLFTSFLLFFPLSAFNYNIFHFGIFMCVCMGKNFTRIHQHILWALQWHTRTHEFENRTVFVQVISAPPFVTHTITPNFYFLYLFFRA